MKFARHPTTQSGLFEVLQIEILWWMKLFFRTVTYTIFSQEQKQLTKRKSCEMSCRKKLLGGGFSLPKWSSSNVEVLKDLPPHLLATKDVLELNKEDKSIKVLGVVWYPSRDVFSIRHNGRFDTGSAKRKLLSEISKIFHPLRWIAPITITLKRLMQATWIKGIQWDDTLPADLEKTRQAAHEQLN